MTSTEWGPWITAGIPELGDYIQIESLLTCCSKTVRDEGIVGSINLTSRIIRLIPEEKYCGIPMAKRWRRRKPPGEVEKTYHKKDKVIGNTPDFVIVDDFWALLPII